MTTTATTRAGRERSTSREVMRFVVVAFAGAWVVGGTAAFVLDLGQAGLGIGVLAVPVAALVCARRDEGTILPLLRQVVRWRVGLGWYVVALLLPFIALACALVLTPLVGDTSPRVDAPGLSLLLLLPLYLVFLGGPEEIGWRGYALPRLQTRFSALGATLLLAGIWMAWHAPLFLLDDVPGFSEIPVVPYLVVGVASSVAYTWLYNSTQGSVLMAMLLHAAKNLSLAWVITTTEFVVYATAWVVVAVALVAAYGATDLSHRPRERAGSG